MSEREVALDHYTERRQLVDAAARLAGEAWAGVDPNRIAASWAAQLPELATAVAGAQMGAAQAADPYLTDVLAAQGLSTEAMDVVAARAFAGVASDGRALLSLLANPAFAALSAIAGGARAPDAMATGRANVDLLVRTQVADAGRLADQAAMTARRAATGYVRVAVGNTCSRCLLLAGRTYRWSAGFQRHPRCDCIHLPTALARAAHIHQDPEAVYGRMSAADRTAAGFSRADQAAIAAGADLNQVVNARRGLYTAGGRQFTRVSTTRRGVVRGPRLSVDQIMVEARGDRDEALRLLRRNGYLVNRGAAPVLAPARPLSLTPSAAEAMQQRMLADASWTAAQREALREYTGGWASEMNLLLRSGELRGPWTEEFVREAQAAMRPLPDAVLLYRFVHWDAFDVRSAAGLNGLVGKVVQDRGFASTTIASSGWTSEQMGLGARRAVRMEISAPAGTPAAYVESLSAHPGQWEMLLGAGAKFRIAAVTQDGAHTVVKVVIVP